MSHYKTSPKKSSPLPYGSTAQQNAQGVRNARASKQQAANKRYRGGRVPLNYGVSPDSPALGFSPYPTFRSAGLSSQNSNSASKAGNNNLAVGNANQKYDICASNPSASVCAGTGITTTLPKSKSKKGGAMKKGSSMKKCHPYKKAKKTRRKNKNKTKNKSKNKSKKNKTMRGKNKKH
jgi:hypothetical protein